MQKCSICEKPIYGHPETTGKIVCGSCPLMKSQGGPSGKSLFEVRLGLAKTVTMQHPEISEGVMSHLVVKSNVRNRTILLDGKHAVVFDAKGEGKLPVHLRALFEREMIMKPGRFSIVEKKPEPAVEVAPVPVVVAPVVEKPVVMKPEKVEEPKEPEKVEEEPAVEVSKVDLSFLAEETPKPVSKKASKKIQKELTNGS